MYEHRLLIALPVLCLVLLFSLLALTIWWRIERTRGDEKEQIVCQPCVSLRPKINDSTPKGCSVHGKTCCCKASIVINKLAEKSSAAIFYHYRDRSTAAVIKFCEAEENGKASGKIEGIDTVKLNEETREKDLVYFHKQTISSEFFPYSNGSFLIKKRGIYYVFSQIKYDHDPESAENNNAKQTHALHRYTSSGGFETLIENTRTFSQLQRPENTGTSFISSAFDLKDGDKIMIKSTHTHKLTGGRSENFFGLYVI